MQPAQKRGSERNIREKQVTKSKPVYEAIALEFDDGVARLTLNRPESLNSLNDAMFREIPLAIAQAAEAGARALLLTGAGRGFCSGADLVGGLNFPAGLSDSRREIMNRGSFERVIVTARAINEAPMPVVCAINGVAAGGGVGLALAGDVILMSSSARLVLTFVPKLGLVPDVAATWLMSRLAGRAKTLGASLLGDPITAQEAERWGLVYKVIDDAHFAEEALAIARKLAAGPQKAAVGTRRMVDAAPGMALAEHIVLERDLQAALLGGPDCMEGVQAFREKRAPRFAKT